MDNKDGKVGLLISTLVTLRRDPQNEDLDRLMLALGPSLRHLLHGWMLEDSDDACAHVGVPLFEHARQFFLRQSALREAKPATLRYEFSHGNGFVGVEVNDIPIDFCAWPEDALQRLELALQEAVEPIIRRSLP